jgi:hypothetical protein
MPCASPNTAWSRPVTVWFSVGGDQSDGSGTNRRHKAVFWGGAAQISSSSVCQRLERASNRRVREKSRVQVQVQIQSQVQVASRCARRTAEDDDEGRETGACLSKHAPALRIQSNSVGRSRFLAYLLRGSAARICRSYPFVPAMRHTSSWCCASVHIAAKQQPTVLDEEGLAGVLPLTCPTTEPPPICSERHRHEYIELQRCLSS